MANLVCGYTGPVNGCCSCGHSLQKSIAITALREPMNDEQSYMQLVSTKKISTDKCEAINRE